MNNKSLDYDSNIDDLLLSENRTAENNYIEGIKKSSENSYQQAFQIGHRKGLNIGFEIGFYTGIVIAIKKLQDSKIIILSDKENFILQKLSNLIELFPKINDKNVNITDQYNKIIGLYKQFYINLKIKDLDKSVFIFSKWNN